MYQVHYEPLETFSDTIGPLTMTVSSSAMTAVLTGLQEFVDYNHLSLSLHQCRGGAL